MAFPPTYMQQQKREKTLISSPSDISNASTVHTFRTASSRQTERPGSQTIPFPTMMDSYDSQAGNMFGNDDLHNSPPRVVRLDGFVSPPRTPQGAKSPSRSATEYFPSRHNDIQIDKSLPPVVESIRQGWQQTCQGSAVVSGLLVAVAAQLFQYFRDDNSYSRRPSSERAKTAILALCYATIFLNIGATISAFVIIDKMGSLPSKASKLNKPTISSFEGTEVRLLETYGAGSTWKHIMLQWLFSFYAGVLCLVALLLTFAWLQEPLAIQIAMTVLVAFVVVPPMISLVTGA